MDELGYLDDPADRLGMLDAQSFRAARVVVDIGMHLELEIPRDNPFGFHPGETWTPDLGLAFMRDHCAMEDAFLRFEVDRYLGWPGQAPSYKVGERIWLDARAQAQARAAERRPGASTSRRSTGRRSTSACSGSTRSSRRWPGCDHAGPGVGRPPPGWRRCSPPGWSRWWSCPASTSRR